MNTDTGMPASPALTTHNNPFSTILEDGSAATVRCFVDRVWLTHVHGMAVMACTRGTSA